MNKRKLLFVGIIIVFILSVVSITTNNLKISESKKELVSRTYTASTTPTMKFTDLKFLVVGDRYAIKDSKGNFTSIESTDKSVIDVTSTGEVIAKKVGVSKITFTEAGGFKFQKEVYVVKVSFSPSNSLVIYKDGSNKADLILNIETPSSFDFDGGKVYWSSSVKEMLTVKSSSWTSTAGSNGTKIYKRTYRFSGNSIGDTKFAFKYKIDDNNFKMLNNKISISVKGLICPSIQYSVNSSNYYVNKFLINTNSTFSSWKYYYSTNGYGAGATWNQVTQNTKDTNTIVTVNSAAHQYKIVISDNNGQSKSCYTFPIQNNVVNRKGSNIGTSEQRRRINSAKCPTVKVISSATVKENAKKFIYDYNDYTDDAKTIRRYYHTGYSKVALGLTNTDDDLSYAIYYYYDDVMKNSVPSRTKHRILNSFNPKNKKGTVFSIEPRKVLVSKVAMMDENGYYIECGQYNDDYANIQIESGGYKEKTLILFEKGYPQKKEVINFLATLNNTDNSIFKLNGVSTMFFVNDRNGFRMENNILGIESADLNGNIKIAILNDSNIDNLKQTIVHELGHGIDHTFKKFGKSSDYKKFDSDLENIRKTYKDDKNGPSACGGQTYLSTYSYSDPEEKHKYEFWADTYAYNYLRNIGIINNYACNTKYNSELVSIYNYVTGKLKDKTVSDKINEYKAFYQ